MVNDVSAEKAAADLVIESPLVRVEVIRLSGGEDLPWQRCAVADRVFVVTEGRGRCYRSHGRDEIRDSIAAGDVVYLKRMLWHRLVADGEGTLVGTLVTTTPADVELRR